MQISHCSKFCSAPLETPCLGCSSAGVRACASRPVTSAIQDPGVVHLSSCGLRMTIQVQLWPELKCCQEKYCCKLKEQSKRLVLWGYTRKLAFLLEHYARERNEKLAYTIQIKQHLKTMPTDSLGSILSSTLPVTVQ